MPLTWRSTVAAMVVGLCGCCAWGELALVLPFVPFPKTVMTKMSTAGTSKIRGCFIWAVLSLLLEQTNVRLTVETFRALSSS
jgi:hypothetical protein